MSDDLLPDANTNKFNQIVADADALLGGAAAKTDTCAPGSGGPLQEGLPDLGGLGSGVPGPVASVLDQAGAAAMAVENLVGQSGPAGVLNGVTHIGDTIGLNHIGQPGSLVTDLLHTAGGATAGNTGAVGSLVDSVTHLEPSGLLQDVAGDLGVQTTPLGSISNTVNAVTAPVEQLLNNVVNDLHATIEVASYYTPLPDTLHSLTRLGNTIGLGQLGGNNLLTEVLGLPGDVASGDLSSLNHIPADVAAIGKGVENLASHAIADLPDVVHALGDPVPTATMLVNGVVNAPVDAFANNVVTDLHTTIDMVAHGSPLSDPLSGLPNLGNGLGDIGSNPLTDILNASGGAVPCVDLTPVEHLPSDIGQVAGAVGSLANDPAGGLGHSPILDALEHAATGGGIPGGHLPGQGALGAVTSLVDAATSGGDCGPGGAGHGLVGTVTSALGGLPGGLGDGTGHGLVGTVTSALGGLTGVHPGDLTGVLNGLTGGLNGGGSGAHDLVTVAVGPQTPTSGLQVDVLSNGNGAMHPVDVHVGTVPEETPTLANVGVLTGGGSFHFPAPPACSGDALSGLTGALAASAPHAAAGAAGPAIDAGPAAHADLPVAAAPHPLEALAHPLPAAA